MKHFFVSVLVLFGIWLLFNGSVTPQVVWTGLLVSCLITLATVRNSDLFRTLRLTPSALIHAVFYIFLFLWEIIKSNLDVAWRVISPSLPIRPGIVEVETRLKSPVARLILTSSITLTPGTLTVETRDNRLFIHWIDVSSVDMESATRAIVAKFEKHLEVMYG